MNPFTFTSPTDKMPGGWHGSYCEAYGRLFSSLRDTTDAIAEIGVAGGGSLLAYADYFKNARAVGFDIGPKPDSLNGQDRITFYQQNAYSREGLDTATKHGPFALLVDDGPHSIESQLFFCTHYPRLLSLNGIAIVEDVQAGEHLARMAEVVPKEFFTMGIDLRWHDERRYDNLLMVIFRR